jgi:hypothetical protein
MGGDSLPIIEDALAASMAMDAAATHIGHRDIGMNAVDTESGIIAVGAKRFLCIDGLRDLGMRWRRRERDKMMKLLGGVYLRLFNLKRK